ncbi:serine/threonine-protein kinase Nek3 [Nilaparvata lugens]|uniref:serine/threonine-protein kinase Nek3 n=1 Tax=Nilaparvata lugens TaxID=108931 RepID=UPI00193D4527|nr:serine/threonine-protein kinase Nek3 [Nilaparvata lugens]
MEWARGGSLEQFLKRRRDTYNSMGPVTPSAKIDKRCSMGPFTQTTLFSGTRESMEPFTQSDQINDNLNNNDMEFDSTCMEGCTEDKQFSNTCNSTEPVTHGIEVSNGMGPLTQDTVLAMLAQLCDALAYLHGRHIVHRDLCARNVLLCGPSESSLYLKLCDFGVSKMLQESVSGASSGGQLKGSVECLSPEQCMGLPATTSCDIWALGCLLYRIITFHHPFPTQSVAALSRELSRFGERLDRATRLPHCDPLVRLMLSRDPHLRPTAATFCERRNCCPIPIPSTPTCMPSMCPCHNEISERKRRQEEEEKMKKKKMKKEEKRNQKEKRNEKEKKRKK